MVRCYNIDHKLAGVAYQPMLMALIEFLSKWVTELIKPMIIERKINIVVEIYNHWLGKMGHDGSLKKKKKELIIGFSCLSFNSAEDQRALRLLRSFLSPSLLELTL